MPKGTIPVTVLANGHEYLLAKVTNALVFTIPHGRELAKVTEMGYRSYLLGRLPTGQHHYRIEFQRYNRFKPNPLILGSQALSKILPGMRVWVRVPEEAGAGLGLRPESAWVLCSVGVPAPRVLPAEKAKKKEAYKKRQHERRPTAWERLG